MTTNTSPNILVFKSSIFFDMKHVKHMGCFIKAIPNP